MKWFRVRDGYEGSIMDEVLFYQALVLEIDSQEWSWSVTRILHSKPESIGSGTASTKHAARLLVENTIDDDEESLKRCRRCNGSGMVEIGRTEPSWDYFGGDDGAGEVEECGCDNGRVNPWEV